MAIKLTTTQKSSNKVRALVYGDAGVGKTVLCATAPNPIIISAEAGLLSLADKDISVIEVKSIQDVQDAYKFLTESADAKGFETVCLDSITEIAEVLLSQLKADCKDPRQAYGELAEKMTHLIRSFRDIPNYHTYFSAKMTRVEDEHTGIATFRPSMPGRSLLNSIPFYYDEVMALKIGETEEGKSYRYLQTNPTLQYTAKDRSGKLDEMEKPDLTAIFKKILSKGK